MAQHRLLILQRAITLTVRDPGGLLVRTDLVLAQTLVRNLLSNAVKWARSEVTLSVEPAGSGCVHLSVWNDGLPIAPEIVKAIRAGSEDLIPGGRMGLRLCMEIARVLGTSLEVDEGRQGPVRLGFTLPSPSPPSL